jgi:hypothetical protein
MAIRIVPQVKRHGWHVRRENKLAHFINYGASFAVIGLYGSAQQPT